jgi:hypothetical protein
MPRKGLQAVEKQYFERRLFAAISLIANLIPNDLYAAKYYLSGKLRNFH